MLLIKSKYKIAKRLGAGIFEKTQTQKFALSEARSAKTKRRGRGGSDYGQQLLEKQRIRYTYGLSERQLGNYAAAAMETANPSGSLHVALELRADNVMYRSGFASTRRAARQMVSHGHVLINGRRTTSPSHNIHIGDVLSVREGSRGSALFAKLQDPAEGRPALPKWLEVDAPAFSVKVTSLPQYAPGEGVLEYPKLFEFYSR